ncbi:methionyl-tRNA formyltransferase [Parapedobacter sp. 2B3]|uniref:methionyl-tRNA formyltransferase n=1 Tax=Parapedobacter sp. 2B3 TaxID=3342381 RepID=UPI0035B61950
MSEKLKIGYFADGPWSHRAFELLAKDDSIKICFIVPRSDTKDMTLLNYANEYSIPYLTEVRVNSVEFYEKASYFKCDLFVSMSFNQIFRPKIASLPRCGTINCHAGKLPFYRGRNILNWALINDEKEFGITVHFIDEGIDTGDIILQRTFPIADHDDYATLLQVAHTECANILYEAVSLFNKDEVGRTAQGTIHPIGMYCGQRNIGDERIDWNQTSRDLFNFIRAICEPGPIAETTLGEVVVKINKSNMIHQAPSYIGIPGQVIGKTERGFLVKTKDSFLEIYDIRTPTKVKVGDRLM